MAVSKRLRYEVLRRDNHACKYCGATAPEVKLTVDHVVPEALGGRDEPANLVTACEPCNSGKSATPPDGPLAAGVAEDALRWSQAIAVAAEQMLADHDRRSEIYDQFEATWDTWTYGKDKRPVPLPDTWRRSIDSFMAAGLPMALLIECVTIAMANNKVTAEQTFRYLCGIAWKRVTALQEAARKVLQPGSVPVPQDDEADVECRCDLAVTILDMIGEPERDRAIRYAKRTPPEDRVYANEPAAAAVQALQYVLDARSTLYHSVRRTLNKLPDDVGARCEAMSLDDNKANQGDDYTDYEVSSWALWYLNEWVDAQLSGAAVLV